MKGPNPVPPRDTGTPDLSIDGPPLVIEPDSGGDASWLLLIVAAVLVGLGAAS